MTTVIVDTNDIALENTKEPVYIQHIVPATVSTVSDNTSFVVKESVDTVLVDSGNVGDIVRTGVLGPISAGSDKYYRHNQSTASSIWTIVHPLDKYPSVTIVDSAGDEVEGAINYVGLTTIVVSFSAAFSGSAFLN